MITISRRIEELRGKKGLSRPALAAALGFPRVSIEKFETGRLTPNQEQQKKLAEFFGVSVEYLRGESTDPTTMENWLSGSVPDDEPEVIVSAVQKRIVARSENAASEPAPFTAMLKSDAFRNLVRDSILDVLRSEEGRQILTRIIRSELNR